MENSENTVCVVGAGPVGLACAMRLASLGIPSVLIEANSHLIRQGSKACLIQGDALEILDKFGCAAQIAEEGIPWRIGHTYIRGQEIDRMVYPKRIGFSQFVNISQFRIEQILLKSLEKNHLCKVQWGHEVIGIEQVDGGTIVETSSNGHTKKQQFRYVIACDGIRSKIRGMLDVIWTGYTHKDRFLITDIYTKLPITKERHFHFDPSFNPGRQLVMHPQPNDMWRIDWQLSPDVDIENERKTGALDARIRAVIGDIPYKLDWLSTYRFNQRVADKFKVGNVFLAGDAAHALPPYGSRGMNSGIQDVDNLAWKIAAVLNDGADESLLTTYHDERFHAAKENLRVTEATIKFMVPPTRTKRLVRDALLTASQYFPGFRRFLNSGKMAEPYRYASSNIVGAESNNPMIGTFAPDIPITLSNGNKIRLRKLIGDKFLFVFFCKSTKDIKKIVSGFKYSLIKNQVEIVILLPADLSASGISSEIPCHIRVATIDNNSGNQNPYEDDGSAWYLMRPDGHVAEVGDLQSSIDPGEIFERSSKIKLAPERLAEVSMQRVAVPAEL